MKFIAGVDFGSTLTKVCWCDRHGRMHYATADEASGHLLALKMREHGIMAIRRTGIGPTTRTFSDLFEIREAGRGAVDDEIRLQALGARRLLGSEAPKKMIIASLGTGVSYTVVKGRKIRRHPLGSCHGGGTMLGLGKLLGVSSFQELEAHAWGGTPADLLVKDQLPDTAGTPLGELVIAHFWKDDASLASRCASVFNFAACSIVKDLAVLTSIPFSPKEIAVVGSVAASPVFSGFMERWARMLKGCRLHFPKHGAYAAAVGAWADLTT